jgi:hypothetical protein
MNTTTENEVKEVNMTTSDTTANKKVSLPKNPMDAGKPSFYAAPNFIVVKLKRKLMSSSGIILNEADEMEYEVDAPSEVMSIGRAIKSNPDWDDITIGTKVYLRQYYQQASHNGQIITVGKLDVQLTKLENGNIFAVCQPHEIVGICK